MSSPAPIRNGPNATAILDLLRGWLQRSLPIEAWSWLDTEIEGQRVAVDQRRLGIAIGLVGRRIGRAERALTTNDLAMARALHKDWQPEGWAMNEMARVTLLLATWTGDEDAFADLIERLCVTAELSEHIACLKGFAVFPAPTRLLNRAREAIRSSSQPLFEAIALQNPYPADHFDQAAFNQMVVKCAFSGLLISAIVGLDQRRNDDLVRMLLDLVSERRAAGREPPDGVVPWIHGS